MRQPARIARSGYGLPEVVGADAHSGAPSGLLPLLLLFVGLAVATVWYVALPAFAKPARVERSCEVVVMKSGTTKCVLDPARGSPTTHA